MDVHRSRAEVIGLISSVISVLSHEVHVLFVSDVTPAGGDIYVIEVTDGDREAYAVHTEVEGVDRLFPSAAAVVQFLRSRDSWFDEAHLVTNGRTRCLFSGVQSGENC